MVEDNLREGFAIEGQRDPAIREEGPDPVAQRQGKTQDAEDVDQAADMQVIEETLDVKEEEGSDSATFNAGLDCMDHAQDSVRCHMVVAGPKLAGGKELEARGIEEDALRDNLLQEFTTALKEGNGVIRFRNLVIYFTRFQNGDHSCRMPRVMPKAYSSIENGGEARGGSRVAPFQEFVGDACGARSGFVGSAGEIAGDFLIGNGCEFPRGEWDGVGGIRVRDRFWDNREKSVRQNLA